MNSQLTHAEFAAQLHQMADFITDHPELPVYSVWAWRGGDAMVAADSLLKVADGRKVTLEGDAGRYTAPHARIELFNAFEVTVKVDRSTLVPVAPTTVSYALPEVAQ